MTHLEARYVLSGVLNDYIFTHKAFSSICRSAPKNCWVMVYFPKKFYFFFFLSVWEGYVQDQSDVFF